MNKLEKENDMLFNLYSENRGGIEAAKFLSKLLSQAPKLTEVNASSNLMPIESLNIICSALKLTRGIYLVTSSSIMTSFHPDFRVTVVMLKHRYQTFICKSTSVLLAMYDSHESGQISKR